MLFFKKFITESAATKGKIGKIWEKSRKQSKKSKPVRNSLLHYMYNSSPLLYVLILIEQYSCGELEQVGGQRGEWKEPTFGEHI